eukprot:SAG11_NODE_1452_length_4879_cov_58.685983_3_plen_419_part_00
MSVFFLQEFSFAFSDSEEEVECEDAEEEAIERVRAYMEVAANARAMKNWEPEIWEPLLYEGVLYELRRFEKHTGEIECYTGGACHPEILEERRVAEEEGFSDVSEYMSDPKGTYDEDTKTMNWDNDTFVISPWHNVFNGDEEHHEYNKTLPQNLRLDPAARQKHNKLYGKRIMEERWNSAAYQKYISDRDLERQRQRVVEEGKKSLHSFAFSDSEDESDKEEAIHEEIQKTKEELQRVKEELQDGKENSKKIQEELQKTKDEIQSIIVDEKDEIERNHVGICVHCREELEGDGIPCEYLFKRYIPKINSKARVDVRCKGKMCVECSLIEAEEESEEEVECEDAKEEFSFAFSSSSDEEPEPEEEQTLMSQLDAKLDELDRSFNPKIFNELLRAELSPDELSEVKTWTKSGKKKKKKKK